MSNFKSVMNLIRIKDFIIEIIQQRIYNTGIDANDTPLETDRAASGEVYSYLTIQEKAAKGQKFRNVTLVDEGSFYASWDVEFVNDSFVIIADFLKSEGHISENFTNIYSNSKDFENAIAALNDNELDRLFERIKPLIVQDAIEEMQL